MIDDLKTCIHRRGAEDAERTYFFLSVERTERKRPNPFMRLKQSNRDGRQQINARYAGWYSANYKQPEGVVRQMFLFIFRPFTEKQKKKYPLRLCGE